MKLSVKEGSTKIVFVLQCSILVILHSATSWANELLQTHLSCGGFFELTDDTPTVQIHSPMYPSQYPLRSTCIWNIEAPINHSIRFTVNDLVLKNSNNGNGKPSECADYIEIRDGNFVADVLAHTCTTTPVVETIYRWLWIKFVSDGVGSAEAEGFKATAEIFWNSEQPYIADPYYFCALQGNFQCANRECVHNTSMCNCINDCGDYSDETLAHATCSTRYNSCEKQNISNRKDRSTGYRSSTTVIILIVVMVSLLVMGVAIAVCFYCRNEKRLQQIQRREAKPGVATVLSGNVFALRMNTSMQVQDNQTHHSEGSEATSYAEIRDVQQQPQNNSVEDT